MALYKYVSANTLDFILNGSIRFTQPGGFNDPFELALEVFNPNIEPDKKLNLKFDINTKDRFIDNFILEDGFEHENCNDIFSRQLIQNLNEKIGILCLTRNFDSHLMWAHYADEYNGAVIEFNEEHEYFEGLFAVKYSQERPMIHINYFLENKTIPIADLCIKPEVWSYEKEWRLVKPLSYCKKSKGKAKAFDIYTDAIPLDAIKTITLGERCSLDTARKTFHKVKNTNIALSIAALANWKYAFRYEPIKFNEPLNNQLPLISPRTAEIFSNEKGTLGEIANWALRNHPMSNISKWRL
ncbi:DUF2971 domain-containing protein [Leclercia adecarboxylata]|uniref:DUF2971 domain-containing protein n=1 Tax=Leclercia adecarboxylata TaxID=83655 RepID=UPI0021CE8819|nr:DUF2971 domain-containing protein [Leclercia adecarboxylata]MCU6675100.1 DUF2971 domain-containing protein [Leclercia adecarboxylata]